MSETPRPPIEEVFKAELSILTKNMGVLVLTAIKEQALDEDSGVKAYQTFRIDNGKFDTQEIAISQQFAGETVEKMIREIVNAGYTREEAAEFLAKNFVRVENPPAKVKKRRKSA